MKWSITQGDDYAYCLRNPQSPVVSASGSRIDERWVNVMLARQAGVPLPSVEVIQIGEAYYVHDGYHRISVARALGEECIQAEVTVWEPAVTSAPAPATKLATASAHTAI